MIGNDTFVSAFGLVPAGDDDALIAIVSNAVRSGFAIVLNRPGEKRPVCTLSERDRNAADRKAREDAAAIGDPRFALRKHDCGLAHAMTVASLTGTEENPEGDPSKVRAKVGTIIRRIEKKFGAKPNIGVEVGLSRVLVIDVDTEREKAGFIADWVAADAGPVPGMTVESPGKVNEAGEWVHKHGGHFWFTVPEGVELPAGQGVFKAETGWAAMWNGHQVLVPPSAREEGEYRIIGQIQEAAPFLITKLISEAEARITRAKEKGPLPDGTGDIDAYFAGVPWTDLLADWEDTGLIDRCSCPIFTAPGAHSSPKSATAHDAGCNRPEYDRAMGHWPIHIWTDNGPEWLQDAIRRTGSHTFSKLQWLAWRDHDGASKAVLNELSLNASGSVFGPASAAEEFSPLDEAINAKAETRPERPEKPALSAVPAESDPFMDAEAGEPSDDESEGTEENEDDEDEEAEPELSRAEQIRAMFLRPSQLDQIPKLEPLIEGFFDLNTVSRVTGKSGDGKSFVMLDMALHVACGRSWHGKEVHQGPVFYMVAEGAEGFVKRVRSWEKFYGITVPDEAFMILPFPIQSSSDDWYELAKALRVDEPVLAVFDTQARITVGVKENDATDMGIFVDRLEKMRRATKACVITVHHTGHEGDHGRGSTAVIGALSTEVRVKKTKKGHLTVESEKQKDAAEFDPIKFRLESIQIGENPDPQLDSAVVVPDGWAPADEFEPGDTFTDAGPAIVGGVDEDSIARDRLAAILWRYFSHGQGATPAELKSTAVAGVPEFGRMSSASAKRSWNDLIAIGAVERVVDGNTGKLTSFYKLKPDYARSLGLSMVWDLPAYPSAPPVAQKPGDAPARDDSGADTDDDDGSAQSANLEG